MSKIKELLRTQHGSKLYGLATPQSDQDIYEIYSYNFLNYRPTIRKQSRQTINEDEDKLRISLDRFESLLYKGVPQTLEALFARSEYWISWHEEWPTIRDELAKNLWQYRYTVCDTYCRTAINFMRQEDFKKNRHAFRLCININDYMNDAKFNPTLDSNQIMDISYYANLPWVRKLDVFEKQISWLL